VLGTGLTLESTERLDFILGESTSVVFEDDTGLNVRQRDFITTCAAIQYEQKSSGCVISHTATHNARKEYCTHEYTPIK
jgi:hypothetical protein